jgi:hypothetical protein
LAEFGLAEGSGLCDAGTLLYAGACACAASIRMGRPELRGDFAIALSAGTGAEGSGFAGFRGGGENAKRDALSAALPT